MASLRQASQQLLSRPSDQRFSGLGELWTHAKQQRDRSSDRWPFPSQLEPVSDNANNQLIMRIGANEEFALNHWSFSQLCGMCGVSRDTINRLSADTAARVLRETLPGGAKPLQALMTDQTIRSVHGVSYSRLWDVDLTALLMEFAVDFRPPPQGHNGATGIYRGEQDMFAFLIDPTGWVEIEDETFAPGFFCYNSEVGARSIGITTFWFQSVCSNHVVYDAIDVSDFNRRHTGKIQESLGEIRRMVEQLSQKRDERRDHFARIMRQALQTKLGETPEQVETLLTNRGFTRALAKQAIAATQDSHSRLTVWSLVDALTRLARDLTNAGDRLDADLKASKLLALVA